MTSRSPRSRRTGPQVDRRKFLATAVGIGSSASLFNAGSARAEEPKAATGAAKRPVIDEYDDANIKIARRLPPELSDDDMLFFKQIGLRWVRIDYPAGQATYDRIARLQDRLARHDVKIYSVVDTQYDTKEIGLGLPGRDDQIKRYQGVLRACGKLGVPVSGYAFHPANTYSTGRTVQRGYTSRAFDLEAFRKSERQRFDRVYPAKEIWKNYAYFMNAVLPVAEEANVKMALHPDDPPIAMMNGVAKLFTNYDGYRRAEEIAGDSRHWGLLFCVGTWSEGGDRMGKNVFEMIREFGSRGKIFAVHFRNVSSPLPSFHETFPDDGYLDMYQVMKALRTVRFAGSAIPDHIPQLVGDTRVRRQGMAYCIAYMRALLRRANEEVG